MTEGTAILTDEDGEQVWVDRRRFSKDEATELLIRSLGLEAEEIELTPVLMREATDVEKKILGHEGEEWKLECTERAASPTAWWRLEV